VLGVEALVSRGEDRFLAVFLRRLGASISGALRGAEKPSSSIPQIQSIGCPTSPAI